MLKKRLVSYMVVIGLLTAGLPAKAEEPCDYNYFMGSALDFSNKIGTNNKNIQIPEEYALCDSTYLEAASRGMIDFSEIENMTGIVLKQDAIRVFYKILTAADPRFMLSAEKANEILNTCYDNAYIRDENKIAYASMIRHGIIGVDTLTNPDKVITKESLKALEDKMSAVFCKKLPITIGDNKIYVGSSVNELVTKFGEPSRIDNNEFGYKWYVYNDKYDDFIMVGVKDDVVCGYFTNAKNFEFAGLKSGSKIKNSNDTEGLRFICDANGNLDGVWYNIYPLTGQYNEKEQFNELTDIINANRVKHNLLPLSLLTADAAKEASTNSVDGLTVISDNSFEAYINMLNTQNGNNILSYQCKNDGVIVPSVEYVSGDKNRWSIELKDAKRMMLNFDNVKSEKSETDKKSTKTKTEQMEQIKTPELISPQETEVCQSDDLELSLMSRCADKYLVQVYNLETESYDVNANLDCDTDKIVIPAKYLTKGNMYRVCVSALLNEEVLTGNVVDFTFGVDNKPLELLSPAVGLKTYDDQLEIKASSIYSDYKIEVFDGDGYLVSEKNLVGTKECILDSLPTGTYDVHVTAISHATGEEKGTTNSIVEIVPYTPIINETILEPNQTYDFYYGDEKDWLYFYDEELIAVYEDKTVVVPAKDMEGDPDPAENDFNPDGNAETEAEPVEEVKEEVIAEATPAPTEAPLNDEKSEETAETEEAQDETQETKEDEASTAAEEDVAPTEAPAEKTKTASKKVIVKERTSKSSEVKVTPVVIYKKKITQRIVPATKKYRALYNQIPKNTCTNGSILSLASNIPGSDIGNSIASLALSYQGVPYVWGGTSPSGFDCSGLVKYVCNSLGITNVERTSAEQFASSGVFVDRSQLIPGDFVYFQKNGVIHHVGIYIGNNLMVHAPHTGDVVKVSNLSDECYQSEYAGAKRVFNFAG